MINSFQQLYFTHDLEFVRNDRYERIVQLCVELFKEDAYDYISSYLKHIEMWIIMQANRVLYHDLNHIFAMTLNADAIAKYYNKSLIERKQVFTACMFHDVFHSFGIMPDSMNVSKSITMFAESSIGRRYCTDEDCVIISDIIFCTVFPFRVDPKNDLEKIVRISDLTMCFEPDVEQFANGLQNELTTQHSKPIPVTPDDMIAFVNGCEYAATIIFLNQQHIIG